MALKFEDTLKIILVHRNAETFNLHALQTLHALYNWVVTLTHTEHWPDMQTPEMSRKMIERMTAAVDDLDAIARAGF